MDTGVEPKNRPPVRVHQHLVPLIEQYARDNELPFAKAVNEILADHLRRPAEEEAVTRKDVKKILKRIELISSIMEPAFLELIESSGGLKIDNFADEEKREMGRKTKLKYARIFREIREIL